jgi:dTDP-4-dehydrorhamnose reductase
LRTSWLYGDGNNFIRIILALAKEQADLLIANDQYGAPTSACWLAEVSCNLVINEAGGIRRFISGIYHAVPRGQTTRYALAYQVVKLAMDFGVPLQTNLASIKAIRSSEYRSKALRPMNSSFSIQKLQLEFERLGVLLELPHWNEQVNYYVGRLIR